MAKSKRWHEYKKLPDEPTLEALKIFRLTLESHWPLRTSRLSAVNPIATKSYRRLGLSGWSERPRGAMNDACP